MDKLSPTINSSAYQYMAIAALFILIIFILLFYIFNKLDLNSKNCNRISIFEPAPSIGPIQSGPGAWSHPIRDYYIKTAYNCCCAGNFKNDYVNQCALKNAIQHGARCLDFEIYSINNKPVVAASSIHEYTYKETYNHLELSEAMALVRSYAFSSGFCPNPTDPLILFFRINSKTKQIFNSIADIIINEFNNHKYKSNG